MRGHSDPGKTGAFVVAAIAVIGVAFTGCTAGRAMPSAARQSPTPIMCDDNPGHFTPMPADCFVPTELPTPPVSATATATYVRLTVDSNFTLPSGMATLPPATPGKGRTVYSPPKGSGARLIGLGPDDTIYILLEKPLPVAKPTPTSAFVAPDVRASVIALRPDGSTRPGWPSAGVSISGYPASYKVSDEGTVFVASGPNPYGGQAQDAQLSLTITAIGSDGKILPGWPYKTPAAAQSFDPDLLMPGAGGVVCFINVKPGASPFGADVPMVVYCLGRDGKLMTGWPYAGNSLSHLAVGPDGTVYVSQTTSGDGSQGNHPIHVLAIGQDGQPKPGWTPLVISSDQGLAAIRPATEGHVLVVPAGPAQLVMVDSTGKTLVDHPELSDGVTFSNYADEVVTADGRLYVAVDGGIGGFVNAYSADGSEIAGWPQRISEGSDLAVGPQGDVWAAWTVYGPTDTDQTSVVAAFDKNANLKAGYPLATDYLSSYESYGLRVASDGTAYATALTATGSRIVAFGP